MGFGGHVISLVRAKEVEAFVERTKRDYKQRTNLTPQIWVNDPSDGAREVEGVVIPQE
jgi:galactokinase